MNCLLYVSAGTISMLHASKSSINKDRNIFLVHLKDSIVLLQRVLLFSMLLARFNSSIAGEVVVEAEEEGNLKDKAVIMS